MTPRLRQRGFTLIEILVAVAIVAIAMGAIIAGMARFTDNAAYLRQKTIAIWVAHNQLVDLELERRWPDIGKSNGETEMAGSTWKWEIDVQETQDPNLRRVDVRVSAPDARKGRTADEHKISLVRLSAFFANARRQ